MLSDLYRQENSFVLCLIFVPVSLQSAIDYIMYLACILYLAWSAGCIIFVLAV